MLVGGEGGDFVDDVKAFDDFPEHRVLAVQVGASPDGKVIGTLGVGHFNLTLSGFPGVGKLFFNDARHLAELLHSVCCPERIEKGLFRVVVFLLDFPFDGDVDRLDVVIQFCLRVLLAVDNVELGNVRHDTLSAFMLSGWRGAARAPFLW